MWKPDDRELALAWLAYKNLREINRMRFNPSRKSEGPPISPREMVSEYNLGSDFMGNPEGCLKPEKLIEYLAKVKNISSTEDVFSQQDIANAMHDIEEADRERVAIEGRSQELRSWITLKWWKSRSKTIAWGIMYLFLLCGLSYYFTYMAVSLSDEFGSSTWFVWSCIGLYILGLWMLLDVFLKPIEAFYFHKKGNAIKGEQGSFTGKLMTLFSGFFGLFIALSSICGVVEENSFVVPNLIKVTDWYLYGMDQIIRAAFFDLAEIYELDISGFRHKDSFLASTLVFSFRTTIGLCLLSLVVTAIQKDHRS